MVAVRDLTPASRARVRLARRTSRVLVGVVLAAAAVVLVLALRTAVDRSAEHGVDWLPLIESAINDLVFAAIAVFFLHTLPERVQRGQLLRLLHRLRSLAHVIDMHQHTLDPERLRPTSCRPRSADPPT